MRGRASAEDTDSSSVRHFPVIRLFQAAKSLLGWRRRQHRNTIAPSIARPTNPPRTPPATAGAETRGVLALPGSDAFPRFVSAPPKRAVVSGVGTAVGLSVSWLPEELTVVVGSTALQSRLVLSDGRIGGRDLIEIVKDDRSAVADEIGGAEVGDVRVPPFAMLVSVGRGRGSVTVVVNVIIDRLMLPLAVTAVGALVTGDIADCTGGLFVR